RVPPIVQRLEAHRARVDHQQPAGEPFAEPDDLADHLECHHGADHAGERAENAGLRAGRDRAGGRRRGKQAAIGRVRLAVRAALSTCGLPISPVAWMIWRCRLESDTSSSSITPSVPTPVAARYISAGAPSPPAPITSTRARFSAACPGPPTSRKTIWRA